MELPAKFRDKMKSILGEEFPDYLEAMDEKRRYGLRVNTRKVSLENLEEKLGLPLERMPFVDNGFSYEGDLVPSKHPYYAAGLYYLQEPSAMLPAACLPVEKGDCVLDLCAAPGGKATELGRRLGGTGFLLANDVSRSRAKGLLKNIELWGIQNTFVTAETPERLSAVYGEAFDKILVDAPCSGEGMFRKDGALIKSWQKRGPSYYHEIQCAVVTQALKMLKPGGLLLYSTCTFSPEEDEAVVQHMLSHSENLHILELPRIGGFSPGRPDLIEGGSHELTSCVRVYPHKFRGEGHFLALLKKGADGDKPSAGPQKDAAFPLFGDGSFERVKGGDQKELAGFLKDLASENGGHVRLLGGDSLSEGACLVKKDDYVCFLARPGMYRPSLRYLRTGLLLGMLKNGRFEPFQALAMAMDAKNCPMSLSLPASDGRILRYLKGETLDLSDLCPDPVKGYRLLCVDGFALGWIKGNGGLMKNKYAPGWRWQG